ncbi:MAG: hypothetical protein RJA10_4123 [Pseudomonadota bacterium]
MTDPDPLSASPPHPGPIDILDATASADGPLTARFVRYPDCQQLQLWLPVPDLQGHRRLQVQRDDGLLVEDTTVGQRLGGSVQMLFDTLPWPPGRYRLQIGDEGHAQALSVTFVKRQAGEADATPPSPAAPPAPPGPIRYRDGFGRWLPDEDLDLRGAAWGTLLQRLSRQLHGQLHDRSGPVVYEEAWPQPRRITFAQPAAPRAGRWELPVPTPERWPAETGFAADEREEVLQFVADRLLSRLPPGWGAAVRHGIIDFREREARRV